MTELKAQPQVGIFWLLNGRLIIHGVALEEAELFGSRFFNAPGHDTYWDLLRDRGLVPTDLEYDEPPRGRVIYDAIGDRYYFYADRCILRQPLLVQPAASVRGLGGDAPGHHAPTG